MIARVAIFAPWILAALTAGAAVLVLIRPAVPVAENEIEIPETATATETTLQAVPALTKGDMTAPSGAILAKSPFDPTRRPFQRNPQQAQPEQVETPPRLLGVFGREGRLSAMIEWPASGETQEVRVGNHTPLGRVEMIDASQILLKNGDNEILVRMFD